VVRKKKTAVKSAKLRIRQIRSGSGRPAAHRATLRALGLRHHQHEVTQTDTPAVRGMIFQVRHLVEVMPATEGEA